MPETSFRKGADSMRKILSLLLWSLILSITGSSLSGSSMDSVRYSPAPEETFSSLCSEEEEEFPSDSPAKESPFYADYELLWDILKNTYPYLPYLENQGIDVDGVYARYAKTLGSVTSEEAFYVMLQDMFWVLGHFAHLEVVSPETYQTDYSFYLSDASLQAASENATEEEESPGSFAPVVYIQYYPDCHALYLKIDSFSHELVERDRDIVLDALSQYPETEHLIFDITANKGGSDYYWIKDLVAPLGGHYEFSWRNFFKSSPVLEQYYPGIGFPVSELTDAPDWVEELGLDQYYITSWDVPMIAYENKDGSEDDGSVSCAEAGATESPYRSIRKWVLIGPNVYSASDKFACFCKATGWATLVGTSTSGDGLGFTPILFLLPDSGLYIRFSPAAGEGLDGSLNAATGTKPDIPCLKGTSPLTRCLQEIRE